MKVQQHLGDINITFRQSKCAIKLRPFVKLRNINPQDFDTDHVVLLEGGNLAP
jgi:hypothetical protein